VQHLHFEICYYQAIDYAIAHGLARVEAGAQGGHKLSRGYRPVPTYSAALPR
jgi:predicted N-acyltransferase